MKAKAPEFYTEMFSTAEARNSVTTSAQAQKLIDLMEENIEHAELPPVYDWLVAHRDHLKTQKL